MRRTRKREGGPNWQAPRVCRRTAGRRRGVAGNGYVNGCRVENRNGTDRPVVATGTIRTGSSVVAPEAKDLLYLLRVVQRNHHRLEPVLRRPLARLGARRVRELHRAPARGVAQQLEPRRAARRARKDVVDPRFARLLRGPLLVRRPRDERLAVGASQRRVAGSQAGGRGAKVLVEVAGDEGERGRGRRVSRGKVEESPSWAATPPRWWVQSTRTAAPLATCTRSTRPVVALGLSGGYGRLARAASVKADARYAMPSSGR